MRNLRWKTKKKRLGRGTRSYNELFSLFIAVFIATRAKMIPGGLCSIRKQNLSIIEVVKECGL